VCGKIPTVREQSVVGTRCSFGPMPGQHARPASRVSREIGARATVAPEVLVAGGGQAHVTCPRRNLRFCACEPTIAKGNRAEAAEVTRVIVHVREFRDKRSQGDQDLLFLHSVGVQGGAPLSRDQLAEIQAGAERSEGSLRR
jgi:hypothetical protein